MNSRGPTWSRSPACTGHSSPGGTRDWLTKVASPLFNNFSYSRSMFGTVRDPATGVCCLRRWAGSPIPISAGNTGQLVDVTMRSQFNKVGSDYHLYLDTPTVYDPVAISVPGNHGTVLTSPVGVQAADVDRGAGRQLDRAAQPLGLVVRQPGEGDDDAVDRAGRDGVELDRPAAAARLGAAGIGVQQRHAGVGYDVAHDCHVK